MVADQLQIGTYHTGTTCWWLWQCGGLLWMGAGDSYFTRAVVARRMWLHMHSSQEQDSIYPKPHNTRPIQRPSNRGTQNIRHARGAQAHIHALPRATRHAFLLLQIIRDPLQQIRGPTERIERHKRLAPLADPGVPARSLILAALAEDERAGDDPRRVLPRHPRHRVRRAREVHEARDKQRESGRRDVCRARLDREFTAGGEVERAQPHDDVRGGREGVREGHRDAEGWRLRGVDGVEADRAVLHGAPETRRDEVCADGAVWRPVGGQREGSVSGVDGGACELDFDTRLARPHVQGGEPGEEVRGRAGGMLDGDGGRAVEFEFANHAGDDVGGHFS